MFSSSAAVYGDVGYAFVNVTPETDINPADKIVNVNYRVTRGPVHDYPLTSAYVGFLLPLMIEVQHLARHDR